MFERFTDRSRRLLPRAREEALLLGHDPIGPGHLLLALTRDETLAALAIDTVELRRRMSISTDLGRGQELSSPSGIQFSPEAIAALDLSQDVARELGHSYISAGHVMLGLLRLDERSAGIFAGLGVDIDRIREQVLLLDQLDVAPENGLVAPPDQAIASGEVQDVTFQSVDPRMSYLQSLGVVLERFRSVGLTVVTEDHGLRWGRIECSRCKQQFIVWRTPRDLASHGKQISRFLDEHTTEET